MKDHDVRVCPPCREARADGALLSYRCSMQMGNGRKLSLKMSRPYQRTANPINEHTMDREYQERVDFTLSTGVPA